MLVSGRLADDAFAATRLLAAYAVLSPPDAVLRLFATSHERRPEFRAERCRNELYRLVLAAASAQRQRRGRRMEAVVRRGRSLVAEAAAAAQQSKINEMKLTNNG
ncbi:hypothetical protein OsI_00876 [Oryza sativa Indica Group]|uniref:Uncharacterized protein n=1 Tax=Oryza sativa subsp. indica TaxID=39946 RepID=B8AAN1_ORYSI|nr:hypothetical protein OsI_00876 [Oryza sativa Indica Group]